MASFTFDLIVQAYFFPLVFVCTLSPELAGGFSQRDAHAASGFTGELFRSRRSIEAQQQHALVAEFGDKTSLQETWKREDKIRDFFKRKEEVAGDIPNPSVAYRYQVSVTNDGPAIGGSIATFVARLHVDTSSTEKRGDIPLANEAFAEGSYVYVWNWVGDITTMFAPQYVWSGVECTFPIPLKNVQPGPVTVTVTIYKTINQSITQLAKGTSTIVITDTLPGKILMESTQYPPCNTSTAQCSVPTGTNVTLVADIYDPSSFLEDASVVYRWNMGSGDVVTTFSPELLYFYEHRGQYMVTVNITATKPNRTLLGYWSKNVKVLDAITNLTIVSSSSSVEVGNRETVNVTCRGSPPVELCVTIHEPTTTPPSNSSNTTCVIAKDRCSTTMVYFFQKSGTYTFQVAAVNNVSYAVNTSIFNAYTPSLPPQSVTAIVTAVVAGLCMTCIGVTVFMQHVRRNRMKHVEVANFDFQSRDHSDSFVRLKTRLFGRGKTNPWEKEKLMNNQNSNYYSL